MSAPGLKAAFVRVTWYAAEVPIPDVTLAVRTIEGQTPWAPASWIICRTPVTTHLITLDTAERVQRSSNELLDRARTAERIVRRRGLERLVPS